MNKVFVVFVSVLLAATCVRADSSSDGALTCSVCEFVIEATEGFLSNNATDYVLLKDLEAACYDLGSKSLDQQCESFLQSYGPVLIQTLEKGIPPAYACSFANLCGSGATGPCALCQTVVAEIKSVGGSYSGDEKVLKQVEALCTTLGGTEAAECTKIAEDVGPALITWLTGSTSPQTACADAGICSSPDVGCTACEFIVKEVEAVGLTGSYSEDKALISYLLNVCDKLPTSESSKCDAYVNGYGPVVIKALLDGASDEAVCVDLLLCA